MWRGVKTDWATNDKMTASELNRITENVQYLFPAFQGRTNWTNNDIVTAADIEAILSAVRTLNITSGLLEILPNAAATSAFFNTLEGVMNDLKLRFDLISRQKKIFPRPEGYIYTSQSGEDYLK